MKLNLTAHNTTEERIKTYLEENVTATLAEKINFGTPIERDGKQLINRKTLAGFMTYATEEARKIAEKGARFACIDDATVFGWSIHYFEEEAIVGELFNLDGTPYKAEKKADPNLKTAPKAPAQKPKAEAPVQLQIDLKTEPKKAKILPTPKPTQTNRSLPKPTEPMQKLNKNKPTDTDQISIFDLF